jgi:hypothetical protein
MTDNARYQPLIDAVPTSAMEIGNFGSKIGPHV